MTKSAIIILVEAKFNKRDFERYGINYFQMKGYHVEVWDFSLLLTSIQKQINHKIVDPVNFNNLFLINDKTDFFKRIGHLSKDDQLISTVHINTRSLFIYKEISKKDLSYSILRFNTIPNFTERIKIKAKRNSIFQKVKKLNYSGIKEKIQKRIPLAQLGINPANYVILGTDKYNTSGFPVNSKSKRIYTHSLDYELFRKLHNLKKSHNYNTAIFLDSYFPFHPDLIDKQEDQKINPSDYYPLLCNFFKYIEKQLLLKVVIAAHPRSDYNSFKKDYFGGREIIRGKTAELVMDSKLVLMHNSFSINFPVLFEKPIIFLTSKKIESLIDHRFIEPPSIIAMSEYFNSKLIYLDNHYNINKDDLIINIIHKYHEFRNNYIKKPNSSNEYFWEIYNKSVTQNNK